MIKKKKKQQRYAALFAVFSTRKKMAEIIHGSQRV